MITAAEVGGVDQSGAGGIELRDKGVAATTTAERWLEGAQGRREIGGTGGPADVGVPGSIHGNGDTEVIPTGAKVGGVEEHRVNDQRPARVIRGDLESNLDRDQIPFNVIR